jgi:hypothetical protein
MKAKRNMATSFEEAYPNIAHCIDAIGSMTIGHDDRPLTSFIRAIDRGGMVWEGQDTSKTLEEALQD